MALAMDEGIATDLKNSVVDRDAKRFKLLSVVRWLAALPVAIIAGWLGAILAEYSSFFEIPHFLHFCSL